MSYPYLGSLVRGPVENIVPCSATTCGVNGMLLIVMLYAPSRIFSLLIGCTWGRRSILVCSLEVCSSLPCPLALRLAMRLPFAPYPLPQLNSYLLMILVVSQLRWLLWSPLTPLVIAALGLLDSRSCQQLSQPSPTVVWLYQWRYAPSVGVLILEPLTGWNAVSGFAPQKMEFTKVKSIFNIFSIQHKKIV